MRDEKNYTSTGNRTQIKRLQGNYAQIHITDRAAQLKKESYQFVMRHRFNARITLKSMCCMFTKVYSMSRI